MDAARSLGIEGTPSFLLGRTTGDTLDGVLIIGAQPFEMFDAKIKELLAPPEKPVKR
jgi:predicted DsbA family dithiol-disulfide isomerase